MSVKDDDIQEDYVINLSGSILEETDSNSNGFSPFRMYAFGPFNIRLQTTGSYYRTFLGKQMM